MFSELHHELDSLRQQDRWRALRLPPPQITLNLSSNDYLNLARDPRVIAAAQAAAAEYGCGARASRLVTGHTEAHARLETALATLLGQERALVFPSGYQANLATLATLAGPEDLILSDALNHASLIDGCRLSRARVQVYRHGDPDHAAELLKSAQNNKYRRIIILTDTIFSMDGDHAPLRELAAQAAEHGAALVVDEAHAIGVFGAESGGLCQELCVRAEVVLGTLSKALGSAGGVVAADASVIHYLINRARPFIYSTGLSPICAAAAQAAVEIVRESPELGRQLREKAHWFAAELGRQGAPVPGTSSQIVPVVLGENAKALHAARVLEEAGILAVAIRPPTVPEGTARLRLSVTAEHAQPDLAAAASNIAQACLQ